MKKSNFIMLIIAIAAITAYGQDCNIPNLKNLGYVVVSPQGPLDGGDYGPMTPGTTTSGFQEAMNDASQNSRDVYIVGGGVSDDYSASVVYYLDETLYVPWGQQRRIDGGEYWLVYRPTSGDAVFIEGQGNCNFKFGVIVGGTSPDQVVVRLKPTVVGPDEQINCHAATFFFNAIVGSGGVTPASPGQANGIGMLIDGTLGTAGVQNSKFYFGEINYCKIGLYLKNKIAGNTFESPWYHSSATALQVGEAATASTVTGNIFTGVIGACDTGIQVYGGNNIFILNIGAGLPNRSIVFESTAYGNLFTCSYLPGGFTNNSSTPTNRIITSRPIGYGITTPSVPASGVDAVNNNPYPVEIQIVTAGAVSSWRKTDTQGQYQTFSPSSLTVGQRIYLDPGCKVRFTYTQSPTWKWMVLN